MTETPDGREEAARGAAVARVQAHSPFLSSILARHPDWRDPVVAGTLDWRDAAVVAPDVPVARRLRLQRQALALAVAVDDLAGCADLTQVTRVNLAHYKEWYLDV